MTELKDEINDVVAKISSMSGKYQELITNARTDTKKKYYQKKLRKNNEVLMQALLAASIVDKKRQKQQAEKNIATVESWHS